MEATLFQPQYVNIYVIVWKENGSIPNTAIN